MTVSEPLPHAVPDDATLVSRARDGDVRAYEQLVSRYRSPIFLLASGILDNRPEAEETVREVFLLAWRHLPLLNDDAAFVDRLYRMTTERCLNLLRSREGPQASCAATRQSTDEPEAPPPDLTGRVMSAVRAETRRGRILALPTSRPGRVRISEQAVAAVVRYAADSVPGVRARRCRVAPVDAGPGGEHAVDIQLTVAIRFGADTAWLLPAVRERVRIALPERIGTTAHRLDLHVGDVYTEDDSGDRA